MRRPAVYEIDVERDCSVSGLDGLDQRTETAMESLIGQLPWRAEGCGELRQRATDTWPTHSGAGRSSADSPGHIRFAASWCGTSPAPHLPLCRSPHLPLQSAPAGTYEMACSDWIVWPVKTKSSARRKKQRRHARRACRLIWRSMPTQQEAPGASCRSPVALRQQVSQIVHEGISLRAAEAGREIISWRHRIASDTGPILAVIGERDGAERLRRRVVEV